MATSGHGAPSWPPDHGKGIDLPPSFANGRGDAFPPQPSHFNAAMEAIELLPSSTVQSTQI